MPVKPLHLRKLPFKQSSSKYRIAELLIKDPTIPPEEIRQKLGATVSASTTSSVKQRLAKDNFFLIGKPVKIRAKKMNSFVRMRNSVTGELTPKAELIKLLIESKGKKSAKEIAAELKLLIESKRKKIAKETVAGLPENKIKINLSAVYNAVEELNSWGIPVKILEVHKMKKPKPGAKIAGKKTRQSKLTSLAFKTAADARMRELCRDSRKSVAEIFRQMKKEGFFPDPKGFAARVKIERCIVD